MTTTPLLERLAGIIRPAVASLDVSLWGIELASAGSRMLLRIFIDAEEGVTIAACARVSRHLGAVFDAEDILPGAYVLEVSSPGLERRFFEPEQMVPYIGKIVDVRLSRIQDGRKHLRGALTEVSDQNIVVAEEGGSLKMEWPNVKTAHLVHEFSGGAKPGQD